MKLYTRQSISAAESKPEALRAQAWAKPRA